MADRTMALLGTIVITILVMAVVFRVPTIKNFVLGS